MCDINDMNNFERENEEFWNAVAELEQQKWNEYKKKYGIYICIDGTKNVFWQNGGNLHFGEIYSCKLPVDTEGLLKRNIMSIVCRDNSKYITQTQDKNCVDCEYCGNIEDNPNHFYCTLYDMTMPSGNGCCTCFEEKNHEQEPREK